MDCNETTLSGDAVDAGKSVVASVCGVCPAGCGVNVHLNDGRIERLTPLRDHPLGYVCPRGMKAAEIVYSEDRLLYPQRRVGERGEGKFEQISWNEAFEMLVENLKTISDKHGYEAVSLYTGRGNFEFALCENFFTAGTSESSGNAMLAPLGSPNVSGAGSFCWASMGLLAPTACFGTHIRELKEDVDNADLILVWGANPSTDSPPSKLRQIKNAKKRGARIIVIDHRYTDTARSTKSEWVGIRPGTDGALALGIIHVMINEDLIDYPFVEQWTHGFEDLRNYVRDFDPKTVESITGISVDTIHDLALSIGSAKGMSIVTYTGLEYSNCGVQSIRAVWIMQALAGHLDVPGGKLFRMPDRPHTGRYPVEMNKNTPFPIGAKEYPLYYETRAEAHGGLIPKAILEGDPYPLRSMIVSVASLITSWPNTELWRRALAALDFLVVINRFPTEDAKYADLILPATTMFESESYQVLDGHVQLRKKVIEPLGESRSDYHIFSELADRLGIGHMWPDTERGMVERALEPTGISVADLDANPEGIQMPMPEMEHRKYETGALRSDGKPGFETPTGKLEITSEWFREHGYDALPVYTEPKEGPQADPELAQKFPLVFNSGSRTQSAFRSQHLNIPSLLAMGPKPLVHIHIEDAKERNICDGEAVWVSSPRGRVRFWARVTEDIVKGAVEVNMGGGGPIGPIEWQQANVNDLTDDQNVDPLSGFPVYKALLCDVIACSNALDV